MKKMRSRLAIILAMMMIFTSFEFIGVFAETEEPAAPEQAVTEQVAVPAAAESTEATEPETPDPVTGLAAISGSNCIVLVWDKPADPSSVDGYIVCGRDIGIPKLTYRGKYRYDLGPLAEGQSYTGVVQAYKGSTDNVSAAMTAANDAVRTIRYRVRIKKGGVLKAHGGNGPSAVTVYKGQYIDCYGFGGGKYIFNYGGSIFYCNKSRTNKRSCVYDSSSSYSIYDAECFVNTRGLSSRTGVLVWINTYTQTMYAFVGSTGNWTCTLVGKCSTGKAASPTPTGVSGNKTIWKKIAKRHGIKFWSPFSEINSIHSRKAKWGMGHPRSNGCVRNYIENAEAIYYGAPIGTTVLVY